MKRILKSFDPLIGLPCWNVHYDGNTGLWLQFGAPRLHIREPRPGVGSTDRVREHFSYRLVTLRGEWTFAVTCGRWALELRSERAATDRSADRRMATAIARLDGQRFTAVEIDSGTGRTVLRFDLGAVLRIAGSDCDDGDLWTLYKPRGRALSVRSTGEYADGSASRAETWRRLPRAAT